MTGKVVVITGATSGIGKVAAEKLAGMGGRMVVIARDRRRGAATLERLRSINRSAEHTIYYADLSRLAEMKRVAAEIAAAEPRIDVLINNAGALFARRHLTEDGLELTFATNHLAYFVVSLGLLDRVRASAQSRIINTSSDAHKKALLDFSDLQSARAYGASLWRTVWFGGPGFKVYALSKLCNILFTRELARRLQGTGITVNCFHPGLVDTRFGDESGGFISWGVRAAKHLAISPETGAATLVYLASSPEVAGATGQYFFECRPVTPTRQAQDDRAARALWQESERLSSLIDVLPRSAAS
jgi:NAD(P)-dependent dehydrogenase (short-subunit alcohol dehydrogenase family)